ncbi:hypothetical protein Y032_0113g377 [Ancylostoma ceylanicum]|uniref:Uncharacterized protein n=1 Tax=Ancylostoma ceylanicum TaxID=53326 RepID=A0A016TDF4_9BILA|nr:hypothetical protein Y032_0113g377 [Ancylostoma ceylanicum]
MLCLLLYPRCCVCVSTRDSIDLTGSGSSKQLNLLGNVWQCHVITIEIHRHREVDVRGVQFNVSLNRYQNLVGYCN